MRRSRAPSVVAARRSVTAGGIGFRPPRVVSEGLAPRREPLVLMTGSPSPQAVHATSTSQSALKRPRLAPRPAPRVPSPSASAQASRPKTAAGISMQLGKSIGSSQASKPQTNRVVTMQTGQKSKHQDPRPPHRAIKPSPTAKSQSRIPESVGKQGKIGAGARQKRCVASSSSEEDWNSDESFSDEDTSDEDVMSVGTSDGDTEGCSRQRRQRLRRRWDYGSDSEDGRACGKAADAESAPLPSVLCDTDSPLAKMDLTPIFSADTFTRLLSREQQQRLECLLASGADDLQDIAAVFAHNPYLRRDVWQYQDLLQAGYYDPDLAPVLLASRAARQHSRRRRRGAEDEWKDKYFETHWGANLDLDGIAKLAEYDRQRDAD